MERQQQISLQGEWEFYWKRLLEPADWWQGYPQPSYLEVPSSWHNAFTEENSGNHHGYGTYRLVMHVPASDVGGKRYT